MLFLDAAVKESQWWQKPLMPDLDWFLQGMFFSIGEISSIHSRMKLRDVIIKWHTVANCSSIILHYALIKLGHLVQGISGLIIKSYCSLSRHCTIQMGPNSGRWLMCVMIPERCNKSHTDTPDCCNLDNSYSFKEVQPCRVEVALCDCCVPQKSHRHPRLLQLG